MILEKSLNFTWLIFQAVPVPFKDLPVKLSHVTEFTGKGASPLAQNKEWLHVKCPK